MSKLYLSVLIGLFISVALVSLFLNLPVLRLFRSGLRGYSKILPFISICVFALLLLAQALNNLNIGNVDPGLGNLNSIELFALGVLTFGLLSFYGNLIALLTLVYLMSTHYVLGIDPSQYSMGLQIASWSLLSIFLLGDRQPFLNSTNVSAYKMREILVFILAISFMAMIALTVFRLSSLQEYLFSAFSYKLGIAQILSILVLVLAGWFSVASGLARPLILLGLALPSIVIFSFCLSSNFFILSLLFLAILCLAIVPSKQVV